MATMVEVIRSHRDEIIDRWVAEAENAASARGLSGPELRSLMPAYLDTLASGDDAPRRLRGTLESHLSARIRQGFDLAEIIEEFTLLERCLGSVLDALTPQDRPANEDKDRVSHLVRRTTVLVTELFQEHMQLDEQREKRYLRLLQSLSDEALRVPEAPLSTRLKEVLELVMEAMGAQTAAILFFDPNSERLLMTSAAGQAEKELAAFASTLPALGEPTTAARPNALTVDDSLRRSGIHSLVGIRLPPRHTWVAVMYVGLREQRPFTTRELRRLEALGERLTLHLENAKLYAELRQRIEALDIERELRERFVAILAHDLRGPLSAAKLSAQVLARHAQRSEERRELSLRIERNLDRIDRMIRDLLDVSRVRAGQRLPLHLDWCDLGVVAEEVVEELRATHGQQLQLVSDAAVRGIWSAEELRRALWNLSVNAVKYGAADSPITVRVERRPGGARVSVHNLGNPIAPEDQVQMFDLFSRLKSAPQAGKGWGLGLALVRACAEAHGGKVAVQSSPEAGTTFVLELPPDSRPFQQTRNGEPVEESLTDVRQAPPP